MRAAMWNLVAVNKLILSQLLYLTCNCFFLYRTSEEDELLTGYITEHITFVDFPDLYTALIAETFCKVAR